MSFIYAFELRLIHLPATTVARVSRVIARELITHRGTCPPAGHSFVTLCCLHSVSELSQHIFHHIFLCAPPQ